jgi:L-alanine-DL-glutamate epimerase-like enolase superfamily enzyme
VQLDARAQRAFRDKASTPPIKYEDGCFLLPEGPGLGIEPDFEVLKEMTFRPQPKNERQGVDADRKLTSQT